nr:hypothetical protein [Tanacetum cinerariifolium]
MHDELLQFKLLKVWTLVDLPKDKWAIGTKWVFRNKKDERGIVVKNKARLVAQGVFLAYASFKYFVVYQMDVKSDFLYGKIEEEVYAYQPHSFEDPNFPDKVYKVDKALYRLHQAPRACEEKYVVNILKKIDFTIVKTASTPMEPNKALVKDAEAEDVDVHLYRSMIGSLMYLTTSRPDITFVVCACARFQVTPKTSHLHVVLWIQNQMLNYEFNLMNTKIYIDNESTICVVKNPVFYSKTKHIEIRHHFIRDSYEKKFIQVIKIHTDHNVADILTKAFDVSRPTNLEADETVYKEWEDRMERATTIASSLEAEQDSEAQTRFEDASTQSNDPPLSRVHILGSREDNIKLKGIDGILYKTV